MIDYLKRISHSHSLFQGPRRIDKTEKIRLHRSADHILFREVQVPIVNQYIIIAMPCHGWCNLVNGQWSMVRGRFDWIGFQYNHHTLNLSFLYISITHHFSIHHKQSQFYQIKSNQTKPFHHISTYT